MHRCYTIGAITFVVTFIIFHFFIYKKDEQKVTEHYQKQQIIERIQHEKEIHEAKQDMVKKIEEKKQNALNNIERYNNLLMQSTPDNYDQIKRNYDNLIEKYNETTKVLENYSVPVGWPWAARRRKNTTAAQYNDLINAPSNSMVNIPIFLELAHEHQFAREMGISRTETYDQQRMKLRSVAEFMNSQEGVLSPGSAAIATAVSGQGIKWPFNNLNSIRFADSRHVTVGEIRDLLEKAQGASSVTAAAASEAALQQSNQAARMQNTFKMHQFLNEVNQVLGANGLVDTSKLNLAHYQDIAKILDITKNTEGDMFDNLDDSQLLYLDRRPEPRIGAVKARIRTRLTPGVEAAASGTGALMDLNLPWGYYI